MYPYCQIADVEGLNPHRAAYDANTEPTLTKVNELMDQVSSYLRSIVSMAGYDIDNLHEVSDTVALAITAGSDVDIVVTDGTQFSAGKRIKIEGLTSGVRSWEFQSVSAVSTNTLTVPTISNNYDAGSVTVYVINTAMDIMRDLAAVGVAARAEGATFMGTSPNESSHAENLIEGFLGSEETQTGIWAIRNIPDFLYGASKTDEALTTETATSYQVENPDADGVDPVYERKTLW